MKKLKLLLIMAPVLFIACGSGAESDAKKLCECYSNLQKDLTEEIETESSNASDGDDLAQSIEKMTKATERMSKAFNNECLKMQMEQQKKYQGNLKDLQIYLEGISDCIQNDLKE